MFSALRIVTASFARYLHSIVQVSKKLSSIATGIFGDGDDNSYSSVSRNVGCSGKVLKVVGNTLARI